MRCEPAAAAVYPDPGPDGTTGERIAKPNPRTDTYPLGDVLADPDPDLVDALGVELVP